MSCKNYRMIELQNGAIGAVAIGELMPFGNITRKISDNNCCGASPFETTTSGTNTIVLTSKGYYKVIYSASVAVAAAGEVTMTLLANGTPLAEVTTTASGAGTFNLTLVKMVRVFANCQSAPTNCPLNMQVRLSGSAITGGTSDIIVDSCVNG